MNCIFKTWNDFEINSTAIAVRHSCICKIGNQSVKYKTSSEKQRKSKQTKHHPHWIVIHFRRFCWLQHHCMPMHGRLHIERFSQMCELISITTNSGWREMVASCDGRITKQYHSHTHTHTNSCPLPLQVHIFIIDGVAWSAWAQHNIRLYKGARAATYTFNIISQSPGVFFQCANCYIFAKWRHSRVRGKYTTTTTTTTTNHICVFMRVGWLQQPLYSVHVHPHIWHAMHCTLYIKQ